MAHQPFSKCRNCNCAAEPPTEYCHRHIEKMLKELEPKVKWQILRNAKVIDKGTTHQHTAYERYAKKAAVLGFVRWLWKAGYYEDKKGNVLILKFDKIPH